MEEELEFDEDNEKDENGDDTDFVEEGDISGDDDW